MAKALSLMIPTSDSNWTPASLMQGKKHVAYWEGVKREDTKVGNGCVLPRARSIEVAETY